MPSFAIAGYGALLASVTLNALMLRRRIQLRRRRLGQRIRMSAAIDDARHAIPQDAEPGSAGLLDRALRSLACPRGRVLGLPPVTGALITGTGVELCLAEPADPLPPFIAGDGQTWHLDTASDALLEMDPLRQVPVAYPALAVLGDERSGTHVLVDLAQAGMIGLHGGQEHAREVLIALVIEMAASPWSECVIINCAGFGASLPDLTGTERVRYDAGLDQVLARMRSHAEEASSVPAESGEPSLCVVPGQAAGAVAWAPQVILSGDPLTAAQLDAIRDLVDVDCGRLRLAAVIAAAGEQAPLPGPWQLDATPGRWVKLPGLGREIMLQRVTAEQYLKLAASLNEVCASAPDEADPDGPGEDASGLTGAGTSVRSDVLDRDAEQHGVTAGRPELVIRVLGAVGVGGRDPGLVESGKRNLLTELAAYLRLSPGRTAEEVSRAMGGPRGPWAAATRASNMSRLRAWLGHDEEGRNYVPALGNGRLYKLLGSVGCDWDEFRLLARRGLRSEDGVADLRAALDLVRGQPFAGAGPHSYVWAEFARQEMISAIVEVAHALAVRLTDAGDPAAARSAAARGLEVEPGSEVLYRDLFHAEHRAGNAAGIEEAAERLMVTLSELDLDMETETAELLNQLRGHRAPKTGQRLEIREWQPCPGWLGLRVLRG